MFVILVPCIPLRRDPVQCSGSGPGLVGGWGPSSDVYQAVLGTEEGMQVVLGAPAQTAP